MAPVAGCGRLSGSGREPGQEPAGPLLVAGELGTVRLRQDCLLDAADDDLGGTSAAAICSARPAAATAEGTAMKTDVDAKKHPR